MMRLSHHNTVTGGTTHGRCTAHRPTVPSDGVPGFHQPDAQRVSGPRPALRDRVPNPYGGMADGWETASCKFFGDHVHLRGGLLGEPQLFPLLVEFHHFEDAQRFTARRTPTHPLVLLTHSDDLIDPFFLKVARKWHLISCQSHHIRLPRPQ